MHNNNLLCMVPSLPDAREKYLASEKHRPFYCVFQSFPCLINCRLSSLYKYPESETLSPDMGAGTK